MRRLSFTAPGLVLSMLPVMLPACGGAQANAPTETTSAYTAPAEPAGRPSIANDTFISGGSGSNAAPTMGLSPGGMGTAPTEVPHDTTATQPRGTTASTEVGTLSDGQIAQLADTVNTGEIEQARFAIQHATNARVKQFAQHMISAHTAIGQKMTAVLHKESIVPAVSTESTRLSTNARSTFDSLKSTSASDFDKAYIAAQVSEHQEVLDMFDNKLIPNAQDGQFKAALQQVRPMVAEHRKEAKDIQRSLSSQ
jgi:putative membrane protein